MGRLEGALGPVPAVTFQPTPPKHTRGLSSPGPQGAVSGVGGADSTTRQGPGTGSAGAASRPIWPLLERGDWAECPLTHYSACSSQPHASLASGASRTHTVNCPPACLPRGTGQGGTASIAWKTSPAKTVAHQEPHTSTQQAPQLPREGWEHSLACLAPQPPLLWVKSLLKTQDLGQGDA